MGTHPESSATSHKIGGRPLLQRAENLLGLSAVATLLVYLLGVVVVAAYLDEYDAPIISLARWRYLAAGTSLVVLLAFGGLPVALLYHAVLDRLYARLAAGGPRYALFLAALAAGYAVGVGSVLLCVLTGMALSADYSTFVWCSKVFVFASAVGLDRPSLPVLAPTVGMALGLLLTYARRRVAVAPTPLRFWWLAILSFLVAMACAGIYGHWYYDGVPRWLGGGQGSHVRLMVDAAGALVLADSLPLDKRPELTTMAEETDKQVYAVVAELIDEDADTYYVVVTESVSAEDYEWRMEEAKAAGVRFESAERRSTCFRLAKANVYGLVFLTRAERKLTR